MKKRNIPIRVEKDYHSIIYKIPKAKKADATERERDSYPIRMFENCRMYA